jgi:Dolichyl-phosphate-mannose-protein mannosyltransferase
MARLRPVVLFGLAAVCVLAYHAVGEQFYGGFHIPQGRGMEFLLPEELAQAALFAVFAIAAMALLTIGLLATPLPERLAAIGLRLVRRPWLAAGGAAVFVLMGSLLISRLVLRRAPICDDENTYRFIAQTLEQGALVAPSPGTDLPFYQEQFVVITDKARYGKYSIGYPALLALGRLVGAESLVVPLLTAALVLLTMLVGRAVFGARTAALAALLLALSPQVLVTGGTWLSQPAAAVCLAVALICLLAMAGTGRHRVRWAAGAGFALGYGVLVRPLPGLLFVAVAVLHLALEHRPRKALDLAPWLAVLLPVAAGVTLMMAVNRAQTGQPLVTAYETAHHVPLIAFITGSTGLRASSLAGTVIRLDHWFLGWPLALAFSLLARGGSRTRLLRGVVAAEVVYRLVSPKVGVGTAGPLYMFEALPALALLTADGLHQTWAGRGRLGGLLPDRRFVPVLLVSGMFVAIAMFLPPRLGDLALAGTAHHLVEDALSARRIGRAVIFYEQLVAPEAGLSWAYYPRHNGPLLDDDILFFNFWRARPAENREFWRRRYPDRPALYFGYQDGHPLMVTLDDYLAKLRPQPGAVDHR